MSLDLKQVTVIGMGLLGGSLTLTIQRSFPGIRAVGYSRRPETREKARQLHTANEICDDLAESVKNADLVILASPVATFEKLFKELAPLLPKGCIVTDVGSTKVSVHKWAEKYLPDYVYYVGSHPIAGSEQSGVEWARDDLFERSNCFLTVTDKTDMNRVDTLKVFWKGLGCFVDIIKPADHDRIFANVSHLPHIVAAALVNASSSSELRMAGKGFMDTSRIASGPPSVWVDILVTNSKNCIKGIDRVTAELNKLKEALKQTDNELVYELLELARAKREKMIEEKIDKKEIL